MKNIPKQVNLISFVLSLVLLYPVAQALAGVECDGQTFNLPIMAVPGSDVTGNATLCVDDNGVRAKIETEKLTPGFAYTIWWAYIDHPEKCDPQPCDENAFLDPDDPLGVFGRMDSLVADETGSAVFEDKVHNLRLSSGSQVWLVGHQHGPASKDDNRFLARQLLTPQDPRGGAPASGTKADGRVGGPNFLVIFNIP
jgi:hypothetical protein